MPPTKQPFWLKWFIGLPEGFKFFMALLAIIAVIAMVFTNL